MACLNANTNDTYSKFDIENDGAGQAAVPPVAPLQPRSSRRCSLPMILSALTLLLSIVALALAIDSSVKSRRVYNGPEGVLLTSNPRSVPSGYKAVNMFQGTGYFARLQPMLYPRSDHKVGIASLYAEQWASGFAAADHAGTCKTGCMHRGRSWLVFDLLYTPPSQTSTPTMLQPATADRPIFGCTRPCLQHLSMQTFPVGNTVYIVGGLTNAELLPGGNETGPPEPIVLKANVAYNTYTESSSPRRDMPEPR